MYQLRFDLPGVVFVPQGSCEHCGDTIMAGDVHGVCLDGGLRCRLCQPSLRDQFAEVVAALRNRKHAIWQSDETIVDALIDADALRHALVRADRAIVPSSVELLDLLSGADGIAEKQDFVDGYVVDLAFYLGDL